MSRLLRFFLCCLISFTAVLTFPNNSLSQGFGERENGTNFLEHFYRFLNVKASVSITVYDAMACALECLRYGSCFSFNFAVSPPGRHGCQLLREDKYTFSDRFEPSQFYHHYSMLVGKHNTRVIGPVQTPNFSRAELNSNLDRPKLTKVRLLIQTPNLIQINPKLLVKKPKTETACKIRYNNLSIRFGT